VVFSIIVREHETRPWQAESLSTFGEA